MRAKLRALGESRGWRFLARLFHRFQDSRLPLLAAALAYYAAFSLGPLLLLLTGGLGLVLRQRPDLANDYQIALVNLVSQFMPLLDDDLSLDMISQSFRGLVLLLQEGALLRSAVSLLVLIWASSNFFSSLQLALELIFASPHPRTFWRKRLVAVLLVLTVVLVIGVEVVGSFFFSYLNQLTGVLSAILRDLGVPLELSLPELSNWLIEGLRALIALVAFTLCFRYLPRRVASWKGSIIGAVFSTSSIILMRILLGSLFNVERFNLIYGVITSLILVLLWLYFALLLFLFGALLAAETSARQRATALERS